MQVSQLLRMGSAKAKKARAAHSTDRFYEQFHDRLELFLQRCAMDLELATRWTDAAEDVLNQDVGSRAFSLSHAEQLLSDASGT